MKKQALSRVYARQANKMRRHSLLWFACFLLSCCVVPTATDAQSFPSFEICNDGVDNDNDGLVDAFDDDCDCIPEPSCGDPLYNVCPSSCSVEALEGIELAQDWVSAETYASAIDNSVTPGFTPVVGDIIPEADGSCLPEIVFVDENGNLRIYDGNGNLLLTYAHPAPANNGVLETTHSGNIAIGNVDDDPMGEIFVLNRKVDANGDIRHHINRFDITAGGTLVWEWQSMPLRIYTRDNDFDPDNDGVNDDDTDFLSISLADFNGDGDIEVVAGVQIFDANTGYIMAQVHPLAPNPSIGSIRVGHGSGTLDTRWGNFTVIADVLPDGACTTCLGLELIAGNTVYAVDIVPMTSMSPFPTMTEVIPVRVANIADGYTSVADFNNDDQLEVATFWNNDADGDEELEATITIWNPTTAAVLSAIEVGSDAIGAFGRLAIGNLDADSNDLELAVMAFNNIRLYNVDNGSFAMAQYATAPGDNTRTGVSLFDFDNNGQAEVVYRGTDDLTVFSGDDLAVYSTIEDCDGLTDWDYPIIADIDGDNRTEILTTCDNVLRAFENAAPMTQPWSQARKVWNQYTYFNVNVNDDLTIPRRQQNHAIPTHINGINSFVQQYGNPNHGLTDAVVRLTSIVCTEQGLRLIVEVCNTGAVDLPASFPITIYDNDPTAGGPVSVIASVTTGVVISQGECSLMLIDLTTTESSFFVMGNAMASEGLPFDVTVYDPNSDIEECDYSNNLIEVFSDCECYAAENPDYLQITLMGSDPAALATYGITIDGDVARLSGGDHIVLPSKVFIGSNMTLVVEGENTVVDFTNADVVLGTCTGIEVREEARLISNNAVFRACDMTSSWSGITFESGAGLNASIKESTFINADIALNFLRDLENTQAATLEIQNNLFTDCQISISFEDYAASNTISGNTFQIANVDNITYCNTSDLIAIRVEGENKSQGDELRLSQNNFINGTPLSSASEYTGIAIYEENIDVAISNNNFTDMFRSIDVLVANQTQGEGAVNTLPFVIENNAIEVTRRFGTRLRGEYQIRVNKASHVNIINNTIVNTAGALAVVPTLPVDGVPTSQVHTIMNGGIYVEGSLNFNQSQGVIRDNEILGFEVGIHAVNTDVIKISENKIKSEYYGIFVDHDGSAAQVQGQEFMTEFVSIKCNEIEMDFEANTVSIGIAFEINSRISRSHHFIVGNCIKNTYRAIQIRREGVLASQLPTILNNYMYNFVDAGILIDGEFRGDIGGNNELPGGAFFRGHNSFIGNNDQFASNFDIVMINNANPIDLNANHFGATGARLGGTGLNLITTQPEAPSFTTCANQDIHYQTDLGYNTLLQNQRLFLCGDDELFAFPGEVMMMTANNGQNNTLANNYQTVLENLSADLSQGDFFNLTQSTLGALASNVDRNAFYQSILGTGVLTTNQNAWLDYSRAFLNGDYDDAQHILTGIAPNDVEESALKTIENIRLRMKEEGRTALRLTGSEVTQLMMIVQQDGMHAVVARELLNALEGAYDFIFPALPIPERLTNNITRFDDVTNDALEVYPNPTNGKLTIDFLIADGSNANTIKVFNLQGKLVHSVSTSAMKQSITIDVQDLPQGAYVVTLQSANGLTKSSKFLKQ